MLWRPVGLVAACLLGFAFGTLVDRSRADEPVAIAAEFSDLAAAAPAEVGEPVAPPGPGDVADSLIQPTTTGLLYLEAPDAAPAFTDGWARVALTAGELVRWSGLDLAPPAPAPAVQTSAHVGGAPYGLDGYLWRVADCESNHFRPDVVYGPTRGRAGEVGLFQLHPRGLLPMFYARGYSNPWDPWQQVAFARQAFREGLGHYWTCAR